MKVMKEMCTKCAGIGYEMKYKVLNLNDTRQTMHAQKIKCDACNGRGYHENALFTIEEAKVILKHCGLATES